MATDLIHFVERSFDGILEEIRAKLPALAPSWTSHGEDDFGVALLEILAGLSDVQNYYIDKQALETFLVTSTLRQNAVRNAHGIHYRPKNWSAATGTINVAPKVVLASAVTVPVGTVLETKGGLKLYLSEAHTFDVGDGPSDDVNLKAHQGVFRSQVFTATGSSEEAFALPRSHNIAEQLFRVSSSSGIWYDAFEHPLDSTLDLFYYLEQDDAGQLYVYIRPTRSTMPSAGETITVEYLDTTGSNFTSATQLKEPTDAALSDLAFSVNSDFSGGRSPETLNEIKTNAPSSLYSRNRAVTLEDFEVLANTLPGVKSSRADTDPFGANRVQLWFVTEEKPETISSALIEEVRAYLKDRTAATTDVDVTGATLRKFTIRATVKVLPQYTTTVVLGNVRTALRNEYAYENMNFDKAVRVSDVYTIIEGVAGVDYSSLNALHWNDDAPEVTNLVNTSNQFPVLDVLSVESM